MFQMGWNRPLRVRPLPGHPRGSVAPQGKYASGETKDTHETNGTMWKRRGDGGEMKMR